MEISGIYFQALLIIIALMSILWLVSIYLRNVSIVDIFWGLGFVITGIYYFITAEGNDQKKLIVLILVMLWGIRLSAYIAWRNYGKGEDFRYKAFRIRYGEKRYWWVSFFQTFLLQGILMWLISATLLGAMASSKNIGWPDLAGIIFWITGFMFESVGDYQMARFKSDIKNKGMVMDRGLWRYTRHPNYFGDTTVWWGFGLLSVVSGNYLAVAGSLLMTLLIIKVSGVALLEKSLNNEKPGYREYVERTSSFIPWFPKKQ